MDRALQPLDLDGRATKMGEKGRGGVITRDSMRMQAQPLAATSQPAAPPTQVPQQPSPRIHYLDWLRVLALLGVFLYHAVHPFDTLDWHVKNADQSELISVVLVFFSAWGLGLFFLLAGAGAFFSLRSRSVGGYAAERVGRLLVSLLVAWVLLSPLQGFIEARHCDDPDGGRGGV